MEASNNLPLWQDNEAYCVLEELCDAHQVPIDVLKELVAIERQHQHRERARGIYDDFDSVFEQMD
jgi:hypothetical protein